VTIVDSKVVIAVDAETDGARRQMELLRAQQQHFAAEVTKGLESQNKKLEDSISKWAKVSAGIGTAVAAFKFAKVSLDEYARAEDLAAATQGVRIEGLRKAARGLRTDMDLLTFAAKTNAGAHKLTQEQMELAIAAMEVYEDRGHDTAKVVNAITDALVKGKAEGLQQFGVAVEETKDKSQQFAAVVRALRKDVEEAGTQADVGADAWKRHGVTFQNAMSQIKQSIGQIVVAMTPLVGLVADMTSGVVDFIKWTQRSALFNIYENSNAQFQRTFNQISEDTDFREGALYSAGSAMSDPLGYGGPRSVAGMEAPNPFSIERREQERIARILKLLRAKKQRRTGGGGSGGSDVRADATAADEEMIAELVANQNSLAPRVAGGLGRIDSSAFGSSLDVMYGAQGTANADQRYAAWQASNQNSSKLAAMFGPIEEFDVYTNAWSMLTGAVTTAVDAWVTGSMSAGKAVKAFFAESLRGMAIELAVKALREGAEAIAALASYNYPAAALHGKAAAAYTVGAIAAGAGARLLGAGGSTSAGAGGAAAPTGPATAPQQAQQTRQVIIAYGDDFADDSPRKRAQQARRLVERGMGETSNGVIFA
jgi:hypothetical protein